MGECLIPIKGKGEMWSRVVGVKGGGMVWGLLFSSGRFRERDIGRYNKESEGQREREEIKR